MSFTRLCACAVFFVFLAGCSTSGIREAFRGFKGTSTGVLKDTRRSAVSREFDCSLEECLPKLAEALEELGNYVYAREEGLTAVYVSETDTTPVGIFAAGISSGSHQDRGVFSQRHRAGYGSA